MLTKPQEYKEKIKLWTKVKDDVRENISNHFQIYDFLKNPLYQILESGARGNISNFVQLVGLRGLMVSPSGDIIESPIKSSFIEGLSMIEFFLSTHGARKGLADTALKTADSGYLTRKLVDVAQDIIIKEQDCKTILNFNVKNIYDTKTDSVIISLKSRIISRVSAEDIYSTIKPENIIVKKGEIITEGLADKIVANNILEVKIRNVLICNSKTGICSVCFGADLRTGKLVELNIPVGILSSQSIGEPATQLTMRTFHTGGIADTTDITQGLPRIKELFDVITPSGNVALLSEVNGIVKNIKSTIDSTLINIERFYYKKQQKLSETITYNISADEILRVKVNEKVKIGQKLTDGNIDIKNLLHITDIYTVQKYLLKEITRVYALQGIQISEKYIETIIYKMLNKILILDPGDTLFLSGSYIDVNKFKYENLKLLNNNKSPAFGNLLVLGIKKAPLESESFLSAVSFQDTLRILSNSAIKNRIDHLKGIKENVIVGQLIPCGSSCISDIELIEKGNVSFNTEY